MDLLQGGKLPHRTPHPSATFAPASLAPGAPAKWPDGESRVHAGGSPSVSSHTASSVWPMWGVGDLTSVEQDAVAHAVVDHGRLLAGAGRGAGRLELRPPPVARS